VLAANGARLAVIMKAGRFHKRTAGATHQPHPNVVTFKITIVWPETPHATTRRADRLSPTFRLDHALDRALAVWIIGDLD
jgi:hypothetical protein